MKMGSPTLSYVFNVDHILYGPELIDLGRKHVIVENGYIREIGDGWLDNAIYSGGVALPLPVNTHIHLNDYRALDRFFGYSLSNYAGRKGLKHPLIKLFKEPLLPSELLNLFIQYSVIADYQEDYKLCSIFREKFIDIGVEYIGLSRPSNWLYDELDTVLERCNGLGISNPSTIPPWRREELSFYSRKHIVSAHVSETRYMEETGGLHYLLGSNISLKHVVHGVFLEDWEFKVLSDLGISLVICPRSNIWFTEKITDLDKAFKYGVNIALGSDNAGCFHPDIWLDAYLLHIVKKINPKTIVEMATINGYKALGMKPRFILENKPAYFMIADLGLANTRSGNIYLSVVNRILWSHRIIVKKDKIHYISRSRGNGGYRNEY